MSSGNKNQLEIAKNLFETSTKTAEDIFKITEQGVKDGLAKAAKELDDAKKVRQ